ncbi:SDR family NAD(P)-dependent oxidoreductase, partial [Photobacterium damselae]
MSVFTNKVALVLAGAQGIGKACSLLLAEQGATVYVADWAVEEAQATADEIKTKGGNAEGRFFNAFDNDS